MRPQAPQLLGSVTVLTQTPPQFFCPLGHTSTQLPVWQTWFSAHRLLQFPQLLGSVLVLTQVPLQRTSPVAQFALQTPMSQRSPDGQTLPHWPQLLGSLSGLVQTPLQLCSPVGQAQTPDWHTRPTAHALVQLPQCCASVSSLTQLVPHFVSPAGQLETQWPWLQRLVLPLQTMPHPPQFWGSVCTFTQACPHSTSGGLQAMIVWHVAATQLCPLAHALPQPPQFAGSTMGFTQAQLGKTPQSMSPMGHAKLQTPLSGRPLSGRPLSGRPLSGRPLSGRPPSGRPLSGRPLSGWPPSLGPASVSSQTEIASFSWVQMVPGGQTEGFESQRFSGVRPQASRAPIASTRPQAYVRIALRSVGLETLDVVQRPRDQKRAWRDPLPSRTIPPSRHGSQSFARDILTLWKPGA
jgi:hypothetical protein